MTANNIQEEEFEMNAGDGVDEVTSHMRESIHEGEPLDLTFIDGEEYVELDVHTMQYILNKNMVQEMIDSTDSPETFQAFLNLLFFNSSTTTDTENSPKGDLS